MSWLVGVSTGLLVGPYDGAAVVGRVGKLVGSTVGVWTGANINCAS